MSILTVADVEHRAQLAALSLAAFVTVTIELAPTGLLPLVADGLDVSRAAAGSLVASWALTIAVSSVLLVRLTARFDRQRVIAVAVLISAGATVATALTPTLAAALAVRVVGAAAHGVVWALLVPHVSSLVRPERLGRAISIVLAGPTAATVVGVPLVTASAAALGWRAAFAALAVPAVLATAPLLRAGGAPPSASRRTGYRWWKDPSARSVLWTSAATALVLAGHFALATFTAVLLTARAGFGQDAVAPLLLVFGAAGVGGLAVSGWLSDRRPRAALRLTATAFIAALGALGVLGVHPVVAVAAVTAWGFLTGLLPPVFQVTVTRQAAPAIRGEAGAMAITALNVGIAAGAGVGGVVLAAGGTGWLIAVATATAAVGAALLWAHDGPARAAGRVVDGPMSQSR